MLRFLDDPAAGSGWLSFGGKETLSSYGIDIAALLAEDMPTNLLARQLAVALPAAHIDFLRTLPIMVTTADHVFVHAGIRPELPLSEQDDHDLMWIREAFLESRILSPFTVVHGHTIAPRVMAGIRRINVDTGAYSTGRLSAVRLVPGQRAHVLVTGNKRP